MRITLIQPADSVVYKWNRKRTKRMALGMAYIATAALKVGHDVNIVDASLHDLSVEETIEKVMENNPEVIGISCTTPLYPIAMKIAHEIKEIDSKIILVMGGPHPSSLPKSTLETSKVDFVVKGEGEESFINIIDCVKNKKDPKFIPSIAYNWNGFQGETNSYIKHVKEKKNIDLFKPLDLNKVPYPDRTLFEYDQYVDYARDFEGPQTMAMFSRGCPGKCAFCGAADTLVRFRNLDNIFEELDEIHKLGIKNLAINDDTYTSNKKRVLKISKYIINKGYDFNISVQLRLDQIDKEICDAMFASGVKHVGPGIESGNEEIMKQIGKGRKENKEHMRQKMRLLQEYDWKVRNSYVFGMPGETEEQMMETIEFAKELGADENAFSILVPYPDSPLWLYAKERGYVDDYMDFSKFLYYHEVGVNLSDVSNERMLQLHEFAYEYVGNPAYHFDDDAISSGNKPHIPYLASEEFKKFREKIKNS